MVMTCDLLFQLYLTVQEVKKHSSVIATQLLPPGSVCGFDRYM